MSDRSPLHIIHYFPGIHLEAGGVVRAVLDWCDLLARRGNRVTLLTFDSPDVPSGWNGSENRPQVVLLPPARTPNAPLPHAALPVVEALLGPTAVLHLHTPWMSSNAQLARLARSHDVPYLVSIHGMLDDWSMAQRRMKKRLFLALGGRRYLSRANRIHYTAAAEQDQASRWVGNNRAVVLPPLVDLAPFANPPGPDLACGQLGLDKNCGRERQVPLVLFLSRLHPKKGLHVLLDAVAMLHKQGERLALVVAGAGADSEAEYVASLHAQVQRLGLSDCVKFVGSVTGNVKVSLFRAADVLALPTQQENFGLVLVEALAAGTAIATTQGTDIWRELQSAGAEIVAGDALAWCRALQHMLHDRAALHERGRRGKQWAFDQFDADRLGERYEALYRQMLAEQAGAGPVGCA